MNNDFKPESGIKVKKKNNVINVIYICFCNAAFSLLFCNLIIAYNFSFPPRVFDPSVFETCMPIKLFRIEFDMNDQQDSYQSRQGVHVFFFSPCRPKVLHKVKKCIRTRFKRNDEALNFKIK